MTGLGSSRIRAQNRVNGGVFQQAQARFSVLNRGMRMVRSESDAASGPRAGGVSVAAVARCGGRLRGNRKGRVGLPEMLGPCPGPWSESGKQMRPASPPASLHRSRHRRFTTPRGGYVARRSRRQPVPSGGSVGCKHRSFRPGGSAVGRPAGALRFTWFRWGRSLGGSIHAEPGRPAKPMSLFRVSSAGHASIRRPMR